MNKQAILLVNLGSPESPAVSDVRRFLAQFLMDGQVIDIVWPIRKLLVTYILYSKRLAATAQAYKSIWLPEGSPLTVISKRLASALEQKAGRAVYLAMRYGKPSIHKALYQIKTSREFREVLLLPMYPHFATSTVKTSIDQVRYLWKKYHLPQKLIVLPVFYDSEYYINSLVQSANQQLQDDYDHLLFSYHSLPIRHLKKTDPTKCHCMTPYCCEQASSFAHKTCYKRHVLQTTKAFIKKAGIPADKYSIAYQSKLGRARWMEPSTDQTIIALAKQGVKRLLVICPSFLIDCIETLEEIEIRTKELFLNAGGKSFLMIPCLNDQSFWVENLARQIDSQLEAKPELAAIPLYS